MTTKILAAIALVTTMLVACGGDDDGSTPNASNQGTQASGLSASFHAVCAKCHGDEGRGQGIYPEIPGSKDETTFIALVRSGNGEMPATSAAQYSDADLKSDYLWLTTQRK